MNISSWFKHISSLKLHNANKIFPIHIPNTLKISENQFKATSRHYSTNIKTYREPETPF